MKLQPHKIVKTLQLIAKINQSFIIKHSLKQELCSIKIHSYTEPADFQLPSE